jgi:hypothetical protein
MGGQNVQRDILGAASLAIFPDWDFISKFDFPSAKAGAETGRGKQATIISLGHHGWSWINRGLPTEHRQAYPTCASVLVGDQAKHNAGLFHDFLDCRPFVTPIQIQDTRGFSKIKQQLRQFPLSQATIGGDPLPHGWGT